MVIFVSTRLGELYQQFSTNNEISILHFNFKQDKQAFEQDSEPFKMKRWSLKFFQKFLKRDKTYEGTVLIVTHYQIPFFLSSLPEQRESVAEFHTFVDEF